MEQLSIGQALAGMFRLFLSNFVIFIKATLVFLLFVVGLVAVVMLLGKLAPSALHVLMANPWLGIPVVILVLGLVIGSFAVYYGRAILGQLAPDVMGEHKGFMLSSLKYGVVNLVLLVPVYACVAALMMALIAKAFGMRTAMFLPVDPQMAIILSVGLGLVLLWVYLRLSFVNGQIFSGQGLSFGAAWHESKKVWLPYLISFIVLVVIMFLLQKGVEMIHLKILMGGMENQMHMMGGSMGMHMGGMGMMGGSFLAKFMQHGVMGFAMLLLQLFISLASAALGVNLFCQYYASALKR